MISVAKISFPFFFFSTSSETSPTFLTNPFYQTKDRPLLNNIWLSNRKFLSHSEYLTTSLLLIHTTWHGIRITINAITFTGPYNARNNRNRKLKYYMIPRSLSHYSYNNQTVLPCQWIKLKWSWLGVINIRKSIKAINFVNAMTNFVVERLIS